MRLRYVATLLLGLNLLLIPMTDCAYAHHTRMHSGNLRAMILALAVDPTRQGVLYSGSFGRGVFKTTEGGN